MSPSALRNGWNTRLAPDAEAIAELAEQAVNALPPPFREPARAVSIQVEDWPSQELLDTLGMSDAMDLTGLYEGVPLTERSISDPPQLPDVIRLFRLPILWEWIERGNVELGDLVSHIVVHELAHHFGWSDDDIAAIDRWWE